ncbi:MAG TPA: hypothetical protein PL187_07005, partial [Caldilinea sp.]|nr:hypothetical protein [Caldilinea sp.]
MKTLEHPDQQSTPEGEDAVDSRPASISPVAHGVKVEMLDPPLNPQLPPEVAPMRARQARRIETFRALQHRNFQLYLFVQLVSLA